MAPSIATTRLRKELVKLQNEAPPGVIAEPDESNILKWFYAIRGPSDTPYQGGIYVGKLVFPSEYPMKPPSILMLTPSGRFQINTRICMSMSDFHPESWNPLWSCGSIIQGIQSFMASDELTTGGLEAPASERKKLAKLSCAYNQKMFPNLFGGNIEGVMAQADQIGKQAQEQAVKDAAAAASDGTNIPSRRNRRLAAASASAKKETESLIDNNEGTKKETAKECHNEILSSEEMERRKKKNAKKRAKQKAKKAAADETQQD
jgi:ubiquitin-conjugating enzyme E2 J2